MQVISRYVKNHRGQSMVEFALVLPLLLLLVVGMIGFGVVLSDYITLTEAARAGARYAIVHPTDDPGITKAAKDAAPTFKNLNVYPTPDKSLRTSGTSVTVKVTYNQPLDITSVPDPQDVSKKISLLPTTDGSVLITAQAIMMVE